MGSPLSVSKSGLTLRLTCSPFRSYAVPTGVVASKYRGLSSPDYHKLVRSGKKGLALYNGPAWKGWSNGSRGAWVRINPQESTIWDKPTKVNADTG